MLDTGNNIGAVSGLAPTRSEYTRDPFSASPPSGTPSTTTQRIAANLRQRYRVIGNPFLRSATIRFSWFNMNNTAPIGGGAADRVELQWFYGAPTTLSGAPFPASIGVSASGTNTLMWPGMLFHAVTGPHNPSTASPGAPDNESWGFVTNRIDVTGTGSEGASVWPTLGVYDSVIGVAMSSDDVVDAAIASTGHPMSVALWLPPNDLGSGVVLWARCGAPPTATAFIRSVPTNTAGGAFFQLDPAVDCAGSQIFVAVTNTSPRNRAFRIAVMSTRADHVMDDMHIGVGWAATPAQMSDIRTSFRQAAWQLFGITGGSQLIRSYEFFNDANACDDGWPADNSACYGEGCAVCLSPSFGRANYNSLGKVTLYVAPAGTAGTPMDRMTTNWGGTDWMQGGNVIVHEFGHMLAGHDGLGSVNGGDEYKDVLSSTDSRATCGHTWMGLYVDNAFTFCTAANHRSTAVDFNLMRSHAGPVGIVGTTTFQHDDPRSDWQDMWDDGELPAPFPAYQTQEVIRMRHFWASSVMGRCDSGC